MSGDHRPIGRASVGDMWTIRLRGGYLFCWDESMLPVRKVSKARKNKRRAHHHLAKPNLVGCPKCGVAKMPHAACGNCGYVSSGVALAVDEQES